MTLAWFAAAALASLLGTRGAAVVWLGAAVAAAATGGPVAVIGAWTAVTAGGLTLVGPQPRRVAVPAVGAAGILVAGAAPNAAAFLAAWMIGVLAVRVEPSHDVESRRRWLAGTLACDVPVVAAVVWSVWARGFVTWPGDLGTGPALLLVAAALGRVALSAGPLERLPSSGLLVVRTQAVVLLMLGAGAADVAATVAVFAGAVVFAGATTAARPGVRDGAGEIGLAAVAIGGAVTGAVPPGWLWGVLGAGTILHLVRLAGSRPAWIRITAAAVRGGGFPSPLVAVVVAVSAGATASGGSQGAVVLLALMLGLAGRTAVATSRPKGRVGPLAGVWLAGLLGVGALLAVWAPAATIPGRLAGAPIPQPPVWALGAVLIGAAAGARWAAVLIPGRIPRAPVGLSGRFPRVIPEVGARLSGRIASVLLVVFAFAAVGVFVAGWARGFL